MKPLRPFGGFAQAGGSVFGLVFVFLLLGFPLGAQEILPAPPREPAHTAGVELEYVMLPFGFDDPYGWPVGGGLFYELRPLRGAPGLHLGASVSVFTLPPLEVSFGDSFMIQPGAYVGYDLLLGAGGDFAWSPGLYAGYKHYIRRHMLGDATFDTYRPVAQAGLRVKLWIGRRLYVAGGAEYNLIFDNTPLHTVAFTQRLGLRLGGGSSR